MNMLSMAAFASYLFGFLIFLGFAVAYLIRPEFMPYHAAAVGKSWAEVDARMRVLLLAMMRVMGGSWLAIAFAGFIGMYATFFTSEHLHSLLALQVLGVLAGVPLLGVTLYVRRRTAAATPVNLAAAALVLCTLGFVLAFVEFRPAG